MTLQLTFISELISSFWWIHDENKFSWIEYLKRAEGKSHNGPQPDLNKTLKQKQKRQRTKTRMLLILHAKSTEKDPGSQVENDRSFNI